MLGSLQVNGTLTFKKCYEDSDYYDFNYFASNCARAKGKKDLVSKKGKGSRLYTLNKRAKKKLENATILMRYFQDRKNYAIKFLTLTFAKKPKNANKAVSKFFNRVMSEKIIEHYWWVKEYHPTHYKNYKIKKEHYHCLVSIKKYCTKNKILQLWQLQAGADTVIIDLKNIRVRNKYNSFNYQIVMYVSKYCTKGIDKFNSRVYGMSKKLSKQQNIPIIYAKTIKSILQNISKNANQTEKNIIYYRTHWNQAYVKVKQAETYFYIKKTMENDNLWRWLYLNAKRFEVDKPKQAVQSVEKKQKQLEINLEKLKFKKV